MWWVSNKWMTIKEDPKWTPMIANNFRWFSKSMRLKTSSWAAAMINHLIILKTSQMHTSCTPPWMGWRSLAPLRPRIVNLRSCRRLISRSKSMPIFLSSWRLGMLVLSLMISFVNVPMKEAPSKWLRNTGRRKSRRRAALVERATRIRWSKKTAWSMICISAKRASQEHQLNKQHQQKHILYQMKRTKKPPWRITRKRILQIHRMNNIPEMPESKWIRRHNPRWIIFKFRNWSRLRLMRKSESKAPLLGRRAVSGRRVVSNRRAASSRPAACKQAAADVQAPTKRRAVLCRQLASRQAASSSPVPCEQALCKQAPNRAPSSMKTWQQPQRPTQISIALIS